MLVKRRLWRPLDSRVPIVVEEGPRSDDEMLRGEVVESGDARWPKGLYIALRRKAVHDVERDVVQGEVVEGNDPLFPVGLPLVTLKREEVEDA